MFLYFIRVLSEAWGGGKPARRARGPRPEGIRPAQARHAVRDVRPAGRAAGQGPIEGISLSKGFPLRRDVLLQVISLYNGFPFIWDFPFTKDFPFMTA